MGMSGTSKNFNKSSSSSSTSGESSDNILGDVDRDAIDTL